MEVTALKATRPRRVWFWISAAVLFSIASVFSYLAYVGQGTVVGALTGLPGRELDVLTAQHRALYWLTAALACQVGSGVMVVVALPFDFTESPGLRLIIRFILGAALSVLLGLLVGIVALLIVTTLRQPLVH